MQMQAVFYIDRYFLLPEGYPDFAAFKRAAEQAEAPFAVSAAALREDHGIESRDVQKGLSLAPYFITGYHDEPTEIRITDPSALYPAEVTLLTQAEYNTRLRELVGSFCPGCIRFGKLTEKEKSLNGHFQELCLDGYCAYRVEEKPQPRELRDRLFSLGGFWRRFSFSRLPAEDIQSELKQMLYLKIDAYFDSEANGKKELTISARSAFDALVAKMASSYIQKIADRNYTISVLEAEPEPVLLQSCLLEPDSLRKTCKRFGAAFLALRIPEGQVEAVKESLAELVNHWYLYPVSEEPGLLWYLVTDIPSVLRALHFRAPFLSAIDAQAELSSQYGVSRGDAWRMESPASAAGRADPGPGKKDETLTPTKMFTRLVQDLNKSFFKPHGFKRDGQNFRLFRGEGPDEQGFIVNFQRSIYGDGNAVSFTINLGKIIRSAPGEPIPPNFKYYECGIDPRTRERIGTISPECGKRDRWWTLDEETDLPVLEAELISLLEANALPWLGL